MPEDKPKTEDSIDKVTLPDILPNLPILSSKPQAWNGIIIEHHRQPSFEIPEHCLPQHLIAIQVGSPIKVENVVNGRFQSGYSVSGDLSVIPAHLPNWERWYGIAEYIALRLEPELVVKATEQSLEANHVEIIPHLRIRDPLIQQMGLALLAEVKDGVAMSRLYVESMATTLAVHLLRHYSALPTIKKYTDGLPPSKLRLAIEYINDNLSRDLTLAELAAVVKLSPNYFISLFKRSTGLSPHQYVLKCRIEWAKALLAENKLSIIEVCDRVGFQNHSHFTTVFRRLMGTTPRAYREQTKF
ncbi:AraC family transcriptional regulator [Iningainema tapete]|uniref:Helix-turn-helix transcriptional regulator n=1 Tax=Iningainema tapete BLCC-T55 TaxID=2748662 RepID=A0A8J7C9K7_9CYAN|nr:AraC family transcriptional regulator [Iningainema tapete]MBD2776056.1 helix-turn-helix transcriptional regulator [Iningainema tapete BLCC-T55]